MHQLEQQNVIPTYTHQGAGCGFVFTDTDFVDWLSGIIFLSNQHQPSTNLGTIFRQERQRVHLLGQQQIHNPFDIDEHQLDQQNNFQMADGTCVESYLTCTLDDGTLHMVGAVVQGHNTEGTVMYGAPNTTIFPLWRTADSIFSTHIANGCHHTMVDKNEVDMFFCDILVAKRCKWNATGLAVDSHFGDLNAEWFHNSWWLTWTHTSTNRKDQRMPYFDMQRKLELTPTEAAVLVHPLHPAREGLIMAAYPPGHKIWFRGCHDQGRIFRANHFY